jgi:biotin operon repressor
MITVGSRLRVSLDQNMTQVERGRIRRVYDRRSDGKDAPMARELADLSDREREILERSQRRQSNAEIARALGISRGSVSTAKSMLRREGFDIPRSRGGRKATRPPSSDDVVGQYRHRLQEDIARINEREQSLKDELAQLAADREKLFDLLSRLRT